MKTICNICKKKFCNKSSLTRHKKICHGINNIFYCEVCNLQLNNYTAYNIHRSSLSHKKKYNTCDICEKKLYDKYNLTRHKKLCHGATNNNIFYCKICSLQLNDNDAYNIHLSNLHYKYKLGKTSCTCDICKKRFCSKSSLTRHKKSCHGIINISIFYHIYD